LAGLLGSGGSASQPQCCRRYPELLLGSGEQGGKLMPDGFGGRISIEAPGAGIPVRDPAIGIQQAGPAT